MADPNGDARGATPLRELITSVIADRPLCLSCLTMRVVDGSETSEDHIGRAMQHVARDVSVRLIVSHQDRCRACGRTDRAVFSVHSG